MYTKKNRVEASKIATGVALLLGLGLVGIFEIGIRYISDLRAPQLVVKLAQFEEKSLHSINPTYARRFFSGVDVDGMRMTPRPFVEPRHTNSLRVVIVGGSTVQGYPHPRRLTSSSYLQSMLGDALPQRRVEVFNLGITAISSFAVARVVEDAMELKPDIVVVYTGHNEIYGVYGAASLNQGGASIWVKKLYYNIMQWGITALVNRVIQLFNSSSRDSPPTSLLNVMAAAGSVVPEDPRRKDAERNLRSNLRDIIDVSQENDVSLLLCTVASNERGFAPSYAEPLIDTGSLNMWKEMIADGNTAYKEKRFNIALSHFENALRLDPQNAWSHFQMGRCLEMLGNKTSARNAYLRARDMDPAPWRASSAINQVIRETAQVKGITLVDGEVLFTKYGSSAGIGWDLMDDHVHPSAQGQILLARELAESVVDLLAVTSDGMKVSDAEYRQIQGETSLDELAVSHDMYILLSEEPMGEGNELQADRLAERSDSLWNTLTIGERNGYQRWRKGKGPDLLPLNAADQLFAQGDLARASTYYRAAALEEPFTPWGDIWATLRWGRTRQLAGIFGKEEKAIVETMRSRLDFLANTSDLSPGLVNFFYGYSSFLIEGEGVELLESAIDDKQVRRLFFFDLLAILCEKLPEDGRQGDAERYVREVTEEIGQINYGKFLLEQMAHNR